MGICYLWILRNIFSQFSLNLKISVVHTPKFYWLVLFTFLSNIFVLWNILVLWCFYLFLSPWTDGKLLFPLSAVTASVTIIICFTITGSKYEEENYCILPCEITLWPTKCITPHAYGVLSCIVVNNIIFSLGMECLFIFNMQYIWYTS